MANFDGARISSLVYAAVDAVNKQLPRAKRLKKAPDTLLAGDGGALDSLGIVNLLFNTEKQIEQTFGVDLVLAEEAALADEKAFRTLASYCAFVCAVLEKRCHA